MINYIDTFIFALFSLPTVGIFSQQNIYNTNYLHQNPNNTPLSNKKEYNLNYNSIIINDLCIDRVKKNDQYTQVFRILNSQGWQLCQFNLQYYPVHDVLKTQTMEKLRQNRGGIQEAGWFESLEIQTNHNQTIGYGSPVAFQSSQSGRYIQSTRKALTFAILNNYAFIIYLDESNLPPDDMLYILHQWIDIQEGKIPARIDPDEVERRKKLHMQRMYQIMIAQARNTPLHTLKTWGELSKQDPKQFTRIFWDNANYGSGLEQLLKLEPLPYINTIPNINTGVGCEPFLAELIQKGFQLTARKGGNYLMTATLKDKKTSIRYCIYHAFNPVDARQTLFAWNMYADERGTPRIVEKPGDFTMQAAIDNMNVRPGWVGDFDICTKPRFNWEGTLVEGSEKSAVYFMRGNTAAYFIADNPSYDVLPLARMLDEQLKKGLEQPRETPKQE